MKILCIIGFANYYPDSVDKYYSYNYNITPTITKCCVVHLNES